MMTRHVFTSTLLMTCLQREPPRSTDEACA